LHKHVIQLNDGQDVLRMLPVPKDIADNFLKNIWLGQFNISNLDRPLFQHYYKQLAQAAQLGLGQNFNVIANAQQLAQYNTMQQNLARFAAAKQVSLAEFIDNLKSKGYTEAEFNKKAKAYIRRFDRYLDVELLDVNASADAVRKWKRFKEAQYLYPNLKYITAGDERVRPWHRKLDGAIYPIDHPFWNRYFPPNGWRCRCTVIQTDEPINLVLLDDTDIPEPSHDFNPGKTGILINDKHPYFSQKGAVLQQLYDNANNEWGAYTRSTVRAFFKDKSPTSIIVPTMPALELTFQIVKNISGKPHAQSAMRNNLIYLLSQNGINWQFVASADDAGEHATTEMWFYFIATIDNVDYFLNVRKFDDGDYRIHAINDFIK
jgi:SPP1 gp7 family putative phage head morphogenesis protein